MKPDELFEALGEIKPEYVEKADAAKGHRRLAWLAIAACIILVVPVAAVFGRHKNAKTPMNLSDYLESVGIEAEAVEPRSSATEMPQMTEEEVLGDLRNNTVVSGEITGFETLLVKDGDSVWYLTFAELTVDEVLNGEYGAETALLFDIAGYGGMPAEMAGPSPFMAGCELGTKGVFVLREYPDETVRELQGVSLYPSDIGYKVVLWLSRSDGMLTFEAQNISVPESEIKGY